MSVDPTSATAMTALAVAWVLGAHDTATTIIEQQIAAPIEGSGEGPGRYVAPGETVLVDWEIAKYIDCPGINSRAWYGEAGFHITEAAKPTSLPVSDIPRQYEIPTKIPDLAPNGELRLYIVGDYRCAGSDKRHFRLGPVFFEVAGASE